MSSPLVLEFNDFRLPCPPEMLASMGQAGRAKLERWCLRLKQLSEKKQKTVDVATTASQWEAFRQSEPSKNSKPVKVEHLVGPGGSFGAVLCLLLHYPSFTSLQVENAVVYDPTNPSIIRLARSGFNDENALWLDRFCRRRITTTSAGDRFKPNRDVETVVLQHHHEFLDLCLRMSTSKVLVVFGNENKEYFKKKWDGRLEEMGLWGDYKNISLWTLSNEDNTLVERLVLFLWHPEYVNQGFGLESRGRAYDLALGLAAQLGAIKRSETQVKYNLTSVTDPEKSIKRSSEGEEDGDKWSIIKRKQKKTKNEALLKDDSPLTVVCRSCRYPRCDVSPLYYEADEDQVRRYSSPYTYCPSCGKDKQFVPQNNSPFVTRDDLKRKNTSDEITRRNHKIRKVEGNDFSTASKKV